MFQYKHWVLTQMRRFFKALASGWLAVVEVRMLRGLCKEFCHHFEERLLHPGAPTHPKEGKGKCLGGYLPFPLTFHIVGSQ